MTVKEAAKVLGMGYAGVMSLIYKKVLPTTRVGWAYIIDDSGIEKARNRKTANGPQKKYADRAAKNRALRERLANDPVYREKINKSQRERLKKRYAADPEVRRKMKERTAAWVRKNKRVVDP